MKSLTKPQITDLIIRIFLVLLALAIIVASWTVGAKWLTDPNTYSNTIESIDQKKSTVLGVSAAIAGSATLLAAVPEDATTPLADELMDLSSYLVIVVCVLVLEKSLLTVFGALCCYFLIPLACLLAVIFIVTRKSSFAEWAGKIAIFAVILLILVPGAMKLSDYIYEVNQISIEQSVEEIVEPEVIEETPAEEQEDLPWYKKLWNNVTVAVEKTAEEAIAKGKEALNKFIDAVSLFVIAYCAVPIIILLIFLWVIKYIFGININVSGIIPKSSNFFSKRKKHKIEESLVSVE